MLSISDLIGIAAGAFVILAFYAKEDVFLRSYAIVSNLLFIIYALMVWLWPILILHAILLPLNDVRLAKHKFRRVRSVDLQMTPDERARCQRDLAFDPHVWAVFGRAGGRCSKLAHFKPGDPVVLAGHDLEPEAVE